MIVATLKRPPTAQGVAAPEESKADVNTVIVSILVAIITAVQALVTTGVEAITTRFAERATTAIERSKVALDSRKASADLYRAALALPDPTQRHQAVQFLLKAKLVDPNSAVEAMPANQLPQLPASP